MIKFTKKLAIAASLVAVYSGQFVSFASEGTDNNNYVDGATRPIKRLALAQTSDDGRALAQTSDDECQPMALESPTVQRLVHAQQPAEVTPGAIIQVASASTGIFQTEFLPLVTGQDMKNYLAGIMLDAASPCRLAQLSKAWHQFVLGRAFEAKAKDKITAIPFLPNSFSASWLEKKDLQILNAGTFSYQPEGAPAFPPFQLSTMRDTKGDLVLPKEMAHIPLLVTRNVETFVRPLGENTQKTLVLLLTLSELKAFGSQIFDDKSFLDNVALADLTQNAVCALIRYGGDNISEWGFRYTILKYDEMSGLSVWQIYTHEKARAMVCDAVAGSYGMGFGCRFHFIFEPE